jgi:hypothetical protein
LGRKWRLLSPLMAKVLNRKLLRTPDDFDGAGDNCFL